MVTMIDEIYDRHYQDARSELNAALIRGAAKFSNAIHNAFRVLNRIEYEAPWTAKAKHVR
jgi:hypothetical protein